MDASVAEKWDEREWGLAGADRRLYHLNAVRLPVCNDPVQWAAADAALRAAVTAMAQRLERELAQPKLHQVRKKVLTSLRTQG